MLKVALTAHAAYAQQPARLLHELNTFFCGRLERQFITATYTLIDTAAGNATLASAGHPPPLVIRSDRSVEELAADGVLIGRFANARFEEQKTWMREGDALLLYTDGITEALNASGEMWGEGGLRASAASAALRPARGVAENIFGDVTRWSGANQRDDVTLVVAKCVQS